MATWNKTESWKSFYQKKKPELKTKYPFLKEYQIREKAKKSWNQNKRKIFKGTAIATKDMQRHHVRYKMKAITFTYDLLGHSDI